MNWIKKFFNESDTYKSCLLFLLASLIFISGILAIKTRQPSSWFDEEIHYVRSIQIANGDLFTTINNDNTQYGGMISDSQNIFVERSFNSKLFNPEIQAIELTWFEDYNELKYSEKSVYRVSVTATSYIPISYFPYVATVWLNKLLKLDTALEFFMMRLAGFLVSFTLILLAVRIIPYGKLSLLALVSLPPYFLSMSSISADSYLFGVAPLFLAYSLSFFEDLLCVKHSSWKKVVTLSALAVLVTLGKPPACLLVAILIPIIILGRLVRQLSLKKSVMLAGVIIGCALLTLGWLYTIRHVDSTKYFGSVASVSDQIHFIKNNFSEFLKLLITNILNYNFFAIQLGYADSPVYMSIPMLPSLIAGVGFVCSVFIADEGRIKSSRATWLFDSFKLALFHLIMLFIFLALYLQFTAVGSQTIDGVQPRYFLPFWLLLLSIRPRAAFYSKLSQTIIVASCLLPFICYHCYLLVQL